jgi:hypothetical protein
MSILTFLFWDGLYTHSCLVSPIFLHCDWLTQIRMVILLRLSLVRIRVLSDPCGFVQSKSPTGLSVYKCTEAGINSHITVPSKVCAP